MKPFLKVTGLILLGFVCPVAVIPFITLELMHEFRD